MKECRVLLLLLVWTSTAFAHPNVALLGKATQSSTYSDHFSNASNAIDGNVHGSCTQNIDLLETYIITSITVIFTEKLDGGEIRVGDSPDNSKNPIVVRISTFEGLNETFTFNDRSVKGRYVYVALHGDRKTALFCGVKVYGYKPLIDENANVALRGKATQSSRYPDAFSNANNAIDGNYNTNYFHGSCTQTIEQLDPWWRVDLLETYIVTSINVFHRGDCCTEKLDGAEIRVGHSPDLWNNPIVALINTSVGLNETFTFKDRSVEGRYVSVSLLGEKQTVQLCEVQVHGYSAPTGKNLAIGGKASQSSVYDSKLAYYAVDGNRDARFDQYSCMQTNKDSPAWWRLDLGQTQKIFSVLVTNNYEYPDRLNGTEIRIGDSPNNNGNDNPRCAVITSIPGGVTERFNCNGMDGQYVNLVIPDRAEYLNVCEVEVYGSVLN